MAMITINKEYPTIMAQILPIILINTIIQAQLPPLKNPLKIVGFLVI